MFSKIIMFFRSIFEKLKNRILAFWENYISSYGKSVKDGYVSNAFSPLVWFDVFIVPTLIIVMCVVDNDIIRYCCLGLLIILILFTLTMYVVLYKKDPKLLQSEAYRIIDKKLDLIAQQGTDEKSIKITELINSVEIKGEIENE